MSTFQVVGVGLAVMFAALSLAATLRRRLGVPSGIAWAAVWTAAAVAIAFPELTVVTARTLGISRGADLVFYCGILGMLAGFFLIYVRLRRIERDITLLVRETALQKPVREADEPLPARAAE